METPRLRTGRAPVAPAQMARWGASGSLRTHADEGQAGAVGQFRTTEEVLEQSRAIGGGGDGGKGTGQEEFAAVRCSPDTGPGQAWRCARDTTRTGDVHSARRRRVLGAVPFPHAWRHPLGDGADGCWPQYAPGWPGSSPR